MEEAVKPLTDIPAINRFLSYCRVRTVPSKTVLIHAGDLPDVLYYIVRGSVEVMIEDEEGNEMVLAYLNKGQFFGEMGLFYEQPTRTAWVRTRGQCELAGADVGRVDEDFRHRHRPPERMQILDREPPRLQRLNPHKQSTPTASFRLRASQSPSAATPRCLTPSASSDWPRSATHPWNCAPLSTGARSVPSVVTSAAARAS